MSMDHYFTSNPSSPLRLTEHSLTLRGHTVGIRSASGTFSPGSLDTGTAQLLKYAPKPPATGTFVDIGCGWGPLTIALALESPESTVWGIDVNDRALMATKANADSLELSHVHTFLPEAFPEGLSIDLIWSNPPIRIGKEALHRILSTWLPKLAPNGEAWLVVAKKLGGDSLQTWLNEGNAGNFLATRMETSKGYRIFRVARA
jgi:16S rRNA G1207 methylase RsmC